MDSLASGVGASQVLPYVVAVSARGLAVDLRTFEPDGPVPWVAERLAATDVTWHTISFGRPGALGGLGRVARAALSIRGADTVHARSDLAGAAGLLARPRRLIWDMRSFWADQRIALEMMAPGSVEERILRRIERALARRADAIIVLAAAAVPVLVERHGADVAARTTVIPTCVDLQRYAPRPMPPAPTWRFLLSGTLNAYYDVPRMTALVAAARRAHPVELVVLRPETSPWDDDLRAAGADISSAHPDAMPAHIANAHVGLAVCRADAGPSLTAAMPTKVAEFLAVGRPVVVNRGLGDLDDLLATYDCGVVLEPGDDGLTQATTELQRLLDDEQLADRCRALARDHFDVERAGDALAALYERLEPRR
jgi:glycosyltransferase involved in cell wall biosynthesis